MTVAEELEVIRSKKGGTFTPEDVVQYAENPKTALHDHFTWDDTEAARLYRLNEAAHLIRVCLTYIGPEDSKQKVRTYVSLGSDRGTGKYRALVDVLGDEECHAQMLEDAKGEMIAFKRKYGVLLKVELAEVLEAMERIVA